MVGHGGSSAGSYLAYPTSPIPSHCASIVATSTLRVKNGFSPIEKRMMEAFAYAQQLAFISISSYLACIPCRKFKFGVDEVSMLTHTYPTHTLRKIKVTICNHQADSPLYVWPDVLSGDLQVTKRMVIHDTECPRSGVIKQHPPTHPEIVI